MIQQLGPTIMGPIAMQYRQVLGGTRVTGSRKASLRTRIGGSQIGRHEFCTCFRVSHSLDVRWPLER